MTSSADIRVALKKRFPHPEFGIVFEVAQGTGWKANRHLDAMAMGLWPSRGLVVHGIEIKVSRNDWRRELAQPAKAEQLARFCDFFWLAAPEGVIPIAELPANWGLLELKGGKLVQAKEAAKLEAQVVTKDLLAAVFRAASRPPSEDEVQAAINAATATTTERLNAEFSKRVDAQVESRTRQDAHDAKCWRDLLASIGVKGWFQDDQVVAAVRTVIACGVVGTYSSLGGLVTQLESAAKKISDALAPLSPKDGGG